MEVTVVRLSRPLLLSDRNGAVHIFLTVYGFVIKEGSDLNPDCIKDYVGYLAGLHCISNGDNYFTISFEMRGIPDWADKSGKVHIKQDAWIKSIQDKCIKKLNLTYDILSLDIEEDDLNSIINQDHLIVDDDFYYDLKKSLPEKKGSLWKRLTSSAK